MKIIYYSPHPTISSNAQTGPGTHIREMIAAMTQLGYEVLPVIIGDIVKKGGAEVIPQSTIKRYTKTVLKKIIPKVIRRSFKEYRLLRFDAWAAGILEERVKEFAPDLIYERAAYLQINGLKFIRKKGIKHYMEINAPFIDEVYQFENANTIWKQKSKNAEALQIQYPTRVFVVSTILKEYYLQYTHDKDKIEIVPNCVNPDHLIIDSILRSSIISEFKLTGKTIIGFVGSIFPYHGVDILINAFATVIKNNNAHLLIVGDGFIVPELKTLARKLNLLNYITFTGSVPHKAVFTYISIMHITVMAKSNWYGSPVKLFEYGSMEKAIIAPETSPVMDVMEHGIDGLLIKPDTSELCEAISLLITNEDLRNQLASNFHKKVLREHTWIETARKILNLTSRL